MANRSATWGAILGVALLVGLSIQQPVPTQSAEAQQIPRIPDLITFQ